MRDNPTPRDVFGHLAPTPHIEKAANHETVDPTLAEDIGESAVAGSGMADEGKIDPALFDDSNRKWADSYGYDPRALQTHIEDAVVIREDEPQKSNSEEIEQLRSSVTEHRHGDDASDVASVVPADNLSSKSDNHGRDTPQFDNDPKTPALTAQDIAAEAPLARTQPTVLTAREIAAQSPLHAPDAHESPRLRVEASPDREIVDDEPEALTPDERAKLMRAAKQEQQAKLDDDTPTAIMARQRERVAREESLKNALEREKEALDTAMKEYASRMADVETKTSRSGRRKRECALTQVAEKLFEAQAVYSHALVSKKTALGMYENDSIEQSKRQRSDDFFDEMRNLDSNAQRATVEERLDRIEHRNRFQKGVAAIGKFLNGGKSKWGARARSGGAGFVLGGAKGVAAAKGVGLTLFGTSFPIGLAASAGVTFVVGAGLRAGAGYASRMNTLDASLEEKASDRPHSNIPEVEEDERESQAALNVGEWNKEARRIVQSSFDARRSEADKNLGEARTKARKVMKHFGIGFAIGGIAGIAGTYAYNAISSPDVAASHDAGGGNANPGSGESMGSDAGLGNDHGGYGGEKVDPMPSDAGLPQPPHFELPAGADYIRPGEGFLEAFQHAGLTADQAQNIVDNHTIMDKLVAQNIAYPDDSIGGYGINESGFLSAQAKEAVKQAIISSGYVR